MYFSLNWWHSAWVRAGGYIPINPIGLCLINWNSLTQNLNNRACLSHIPRPFEILLHCEPECNSCEIIFRYFFGIFQIFCYFKFLLPYIFWVKYCTFTPIYYNRLGLEQLRMQTQPSIILLKGSSPNHCASMPPTSYSSYLPYSYFNLRILWENIQKIMCL